MIIPQRCDLRADRHTPFQHMLQFTGIDLSNTATCHAQVRTARDAPGSPLIDLPLVTTTLTLGCLITNGTAQGGTITLYIPEATLEAVPVPADYADKNQLFWDLLITPNGGIKQKYLFGDFFIWPGVTAS